MRVKSWSLFWGTWGVLGRSLVAGVAGAQTRQNVQGEFLVRFQGPFNPQYAVTSLQAQGLRVKEVVSRTLNLYLVQGQRTTNEAMGAAYRVKGVAYAQPNHYVFLRNRQV